MATVAASKGYRYPARVAEFARRLFEDGRSIGEVMGALAQRGYTPARSTVTYWVDAEAHAAHYTRQAHRRYPNQRRRQRELAWWAKYRRLAELRDAGLSYAAITRIARLDFGADVTEDQVRHMLNGGKQRARKLLGGTA